MSPTAVALAVLGAIVATYLLWRFTRRKPLPSHLQEAACPSCGWKGIVSRYAGRCPACNADVGEQRARRRPGG
jgi:hypothetical protein